MKSKFFKQLPWLLALPALLLSGCAIEDNNNDNSGSGTSPGKGEQTILLSIQVPAPEQTQTRALLNDDAESNITEIDIIQIKDGKYELRAPGYDISGTGTTRTFKANLVTGVSDLIIIANSRQKVNNAVNGTGGATAWVAGTTTAQEAMNQLESTVANTVKLTKDNMSALPMFGYVKNVDVQKGLQLTSSDGKDIKLIRSVAKIEVVLSSKAASGEEGGTGNSNFKLHNVRLYNQPLQGWVVPELSSWPTDNKAVNSYFGGATTVDKANYADNGDEPLLYEGTGDNVTNNDILRSIYLFEGPAGSHADRDHNTCIVVGGYYNNSENLSYYRVDIRKIENNSEVYLKILRNHNYRVNVKSVIGPGYPEHDQAFHGETSLMEVEVLEWEDGDMNDIIFDGQHFLTVDKSDFTFYREGNGRTFTAQTDVPAGWKILDTDKPAWITATPNADASGQKLEVTLTADPITDGSGTRTGEVLITAGRLKKKLTVTQLDEPELTLEIFPDVLVFRKSAGSAKSITIKSYPSDRPISIFEMGSSTITWRSGGSPLEIANLTSENSPFPLQPGASTSNQILNSTIVITIELDGRTISKTLTVRQLANDLLFKVTNNTPRPAAGGQQSFTVESDAPWLLSKSTTGDPDNILTMLINIEQPANTGAPVPYLYELAPSSSYVNRSAIIHATSSDPDFPTQDITIEQYGTPPFLNFTTPIEGNRVIDWGTGSGPKEVVFSTNARWQYTYDTDARFNNVVSAYDIPPSTAQTGSPAADQTVTQSFKFTAATNNNAIAGTQYNTKLTFTTSNPEGANEASKTVELKRTVPARWDGRAITHNLGTGKHQKYLGYRATASVSTNAAWYMDATGKARKNIAASGYAAKSSFQDIDINNSWANKTTTVKIESPSVSGSAYSVNIVQGPGYFVDSRAVSGSVGNMGGNVTVSATGRFPALQTRAVADGVVIAYGNNIPAQMANTSAAKSATINIPMNTGTQRTVTLQVNQNGGWQNAGNISQAQGYDQILINGLWWMKNDIGGMVTWKAAQTACPPGWRLPSKDECAAVTGAQAASANIAIPGSINVAGFGYATSTVYPASPGSSPLGYRAAWQYTTSPKPALNGIIQETTLQNHWVRVRCVR